MMRTEQGHICVFLTEKEIIERLHLPERVGRAMLEMWKLSPSFPKPVDGAGGRRWFPEVIQWLNRLYHVGANNDDFVSISIEPKGNFDEWRATRRTRKTKASGRTAIDLPTPPKPPDRP